MTDWYQLSRLVIVDVPVGLVWRRFKASKVAVILAVFLSFPAILATVFFYSGIKLNQLFELYMYMDFDFNYNEAWWIGGLGEI